MSLQIMLLPILILSTALLQEMRARVTQDGTKCAKNCTFNGYDIFFDEVSPIPGSIQLRSTTPTYTYIYGSW